MDTFYKTSHLTMEICLSCAKVEGNPCSPCQEYIDHQSEIIHDLQLSSTLAVHQRKLLNPINISHDKLFHIPFEISSYIFELSLPTDWNSLPDVDRVLNRVEASSPLVLAAVCRTWRRLAFSIPRLWTTIPLALSISGNRIVTQHELLHQWIQRSQNLPLSIWLNPGPDVVPDCDVLDDIKSVNYWLPKITSLLNAVSAQWKNLDVRCFKLEGIAFNLCAGSVEGEPVLDSVRISDANLACKIFGAGEPKFSPTDVRISSRQRINIVWEHVTRLEWTSYAVDEFYDVLACCTSLRDCTVMDYRESSTHSRKAGYVYSKMESLKIVQPKAKVIEDHFLADLLSIMKTPKLRRLEIVFPQKNVSILSITQLISRSSCSLTSISLDFGFCDDSEVVGSSLVDLFNETPDLVNFNLTWSNPFKQPLNVGPLLMLFAKGSGETLTSCERITTAAHFKYVPLLESLILQGDAQLRPMDWEAIVTRIFQRALKVFKIDFGRTYDRIHRMRHQ